MHPVNAITASIAGIGIAAGVATIDVAQPSVAIGAGAVVAASILLLGRRSGKKRYAGTGSLYTLGLAGAIYATSVFPSGYAEDPLVALASLGLVSAFIVSVTEGGALLVRRYGGDYAERIFETIAAFLGLLVMIWTVLTAYEKAIRYAGVGVGGPTFLALDLLGVELPVPIWFLEGGVDATIVGFVGCVLIGFHTLETIHTGWRVTKATAKKGAAAGQSGVQAAKSRVGEGDEVQ